MRFLLLLVLLMFNYNLKAEPLQSRLGHFYWAFGPNFSLLGNVRLGFNKVEFGVLQGTGFGVVYVHRTNSPLFFQIGPISTSAGTGVLGGGGLEWSTSSFFRWRTDITVSADIAYQTQGFVSLGGVFIL